MTDAADLRRRAREVRARLLVRAWEHRQRRHARGIWYRLRRLLADARLAYAVGEAEARALLAEGFEPEPVGLELEPPRTILVLPEARAEALADKRRLAVRLSAELLAAERLVLVRFRPLDP